MALQEKIIDWGLSSLIFKGNAPEICFIFYFLHFCVWFAFSFSLGDGVLIVLIIAFAALIFVMIPKTWLKSPSSVTLSLVRKSFLLSFLFDFFLGKVFLPSSNYNQLIRFLQTFICNKIFLKLLKIINIFPMMKLPIVN